HTAPVGATEDKDMDDAVSEELIIDSAVAAGGVESHKKNKDFIPAHEIDAFWLQRQVGGIYSDPHVQQKKTQEAMEILSGGVGEDQEADQKPLREIENDLMELFDYEQHELVRKLIANKDKVIWLTRLARAEDAGKRTESELEM